MSAADFIAQLKFTRVVSDYEDFTYTGIECYAQVEMLFVNGDWRRRLMLGIQRTGIRIVIGLDREDDGDKMFDHEVLHEEWSRTLIETALDMLLVQQAQEVEKERNRHEVVYVPTPPTDDERRAIAIKQMNYLLHAAEVLHTGETLSIEDQLQLRACAAQLEEMKGGAP